MLCVEVIASPFLIFQLTIGDNYFIPYFIFYMAEDKVGESNKAYFTTVLFFVFWPDIKEYE